MGLLGDIFKIVNPLTYISTVLPAKHAAGLLKKPKMPGVPKELHVPGREDTAQAYEDALLQMARRRGRSKTILALGTSEDEQPLRRRLLGMESP